jgi:hypothetical protein
MLRKLVFVVMEGYGRKVKKINQLTDQKTTY